MQCPFSSLTDSNLLLNSAKLTNKTNWWKHTMSVLQFHARVSCIIAAYAHNKEPCGVHGNYLYHYSSYRTTEPQRPIYSSRKLPHSALLLSSELSIYGVCRCVWGQVCMSEGNYDSVLVKRHGSTLHTTACIGWCIHHNTTSLWGPSLLWHRRNIIIQYQWKVWTHLLIQGYFFIFTIFYIVE